MCVYVYVCVRFEVPVKSRKGYQIPGTGLIDSCGQAWKPKSGLLQEHQYLLTVKPSTQPHDGCSYYHFTEMQVRVPDFLRLLVLRLQFSSKFQYKNLKCYPGAGFHKWLLSYLSFCC